MACRRLPAALILGCLLLAASGAAARTLPLGAPDRWHDVVLDAAHHAILVAHGDEMTVVDQPTFTVSAHLPNLSGAHGIAIVPGGHGYVSSGRAGTVTVFDPATHATIGTIPAGKDANAIVFDPATRRLLVMNDDDASITVIDATSDQVVATIRLPPGEGLQGAAADGAGHVYVNHSAGHDVLRIDTAAARVDATWPLQDCDRPAGLALDAASGRLFVACVGRSLLVLDLRDGHVLARRSVGVGAGDVLLDPVRHRVFVLSYDGTLAAFDAANDFTPLPAPALAPGARSGALDAGSGVIYAVTADVASSAKPADPDSPPLLHFVPGSVQLITVETAGSAN